MAALTTTLIEKAIDRQDTNLLPTFCIIRDRVQNLITKDFKTVWLLVTKPVKSGTLEISEDTAYELIDLYSMDKKVDSKKGSVYDTPDEAFKRKYQGATVKLD